MPIEEVETSQKPKRECWTASLTKGIATVDGEGVEIRSIQVLAPSFKAAALKAAKWQNNNSEWAIQSLVLNPDTVI